MRFSSNRKNATSIKLIMEKIKRETKKTKVKNKKDIKNTHKHGRIAIKDWKNISIGMNVLEKVIFETFSIHTDKMLTGEQDISKAKKEFLGFRYVIDDFLKRLSDRVEYEYEFRRNTNKLLEYSEVVKAARDGVLTKKEVRQEEIDGELKDITYDTTITPREAIGILEDYEKKIYKIKFDKLNSYFGLGLGIAGAIGILFNNKNDKKGNEKLLTIGTTVIAGIELMQGMIGQAEEEKRYELMDERWRIRNDLLENEQVSEKSEKDSIQQIKNIANKEKRITNGIENKQLMFDVTVDCIAALIAGACINKQVQTKEGNKIDGKSLATTLLSLQAKEGAIRNLIGVIQEVRDNKQAKIEIDELYKKASDIISQMEEKVYPLEGAKKPFNLIEIKDFNGQFYPKKNYETGEIEYGMTLQVPDFSMKRGDIVLLSGESGTGKSTFLRFLKRGDINNRKCIQIDENQKVDNLGDEYISFRPSTNLGDENNVLMQITGKESIYELGINEKEKLLKIMRELKLDSPDFLEQLASKKFMEFSTGQQRRLALSKLFYRIDDGTSIIIVDEPVGNVEDALIKEQLQMIKKYAESQNVMLLLTTHRLDLAENLATKRYHINKNGVLQEQPIIKNKVEEFEI